MKALEKEYRQYLPRRSYAVVRVDGKGFSKYTKKLDKPFDAEFTQDMQETARHLAENVDGAVLAYTQSDEISVVFSDLAGAETEWWFGGQVQKIVSLTAAMATAKFNSLRPSGDVALFDARVHHLADLGMVREYLDWRQTDAIKNSVSMLASHHFSHKTLDGVSTHGRVRKLEEIGVHYEDVAPWVREGSLIRRKLRRGTTTFLRNGVEETVEFNRKRWVVESAPRFAEMDNLLDVVNV
jgi:tRNA(His) 5'-end guanylyltransferase